MPTDCWHSYACTAFPLPSGVRVCSGERAVKDLVMSCWLAGETGAGPSPLHPAPAQQHPQEPDKDLHVFFCVAIYQRGHQPWCPARNGCA